MTLPVFSVIIPTFNRRRTIGRAIDSVLAQRHPPGEIILVDDASSDGTADLVRRRFPGVRVLELEVNRGPAVARNTAIRVARHDHLAFLDSDDSWHPDYLAAIARAWRDHPGAGIVYTQYDKIEDRVGGRSDPMDVQVEGDQLLSMLRNNFIHSSSLMSTRRDWTLAVGGFDPAYRIGEDRAMYLRLLQRGPAIAVPRRLVRRHVGDDNMIHDLERWWRDATTIVARFTARPDFAGLRWIEDQSRARVWEAIQWHDRQRQRARAAKARAERQEAPAGKDAPDAGKEPAPLPAEGGDACLFVHAGGVPIEPLSALLTETGAFGRPRPWFDHDGPMLDLAASLGADDFDRYVEAIRAGAPWSALVRYRDLAWLEHKPAFRRLLGQTGVRTVRLRCRDVVLQAFRLLTAHRPGDDRPAAAPAFETLAAALVGLEEAEAFGDDWLARNRVGASTLWLEDLCAPDLSALKALTRRLALPMADQSCRPIDPPTAEESAIVHDFRQEAARRHWSHALLSTAPSSGARSGFPGVGRLSAPAGA